MGDVSESVMHGSTQGRKDEKKNKTPISQGVKVTPPEEKSALRGGSDWKPRETKQIDTG